jgi:HEAT repeat protein
MAAGGNPLARIVSVVLVAALLGGTAVAQGGSAAEKLDEGLKLLRAGDRESVQKAIVVLREALAADLSSEDALAALAQAEYAGWQAMLNLMASGAEGANVAVAILDIATPRLPEKAFSDEELRALVKTACEAESFSERFDAGVTLGRVYGEFAVPYLLAYLGSSNTDQMTNAHITLMTRVGRSAVPPLLVALRHGSATVRRMVANELGQIGDERSLAAVAEATQDQDQDVRNAAIKAHESLVSKFPWAASLTAADIHLRLAQLYYMGNYRVMAFTDRSLVTWSWSDRLISVPVPKHLYVLKSAEGECYDALRLDPGNHEARSMLARVLATEKMASDAVAKLPDPDADTLAYAEGLANAEGTVAALGWTTLTDALAASLDQNDKTAATFILRVMPSVYGGTDFAGDHPVVRATTDTSAGVRIAAAEAILRCNGIRRLTAFPDPDGFINLVAQAVGEIVPRQILVVDARDERRNKVLAELNNQKYIAYDARTGSDGYILARRLSGLDLVIASPDLTDMDILALQRRLAEDDRTKNAPLLVIGTPDQAANSQWVAMFEGKAETVGVLEGPGLPGEEFTSKVKSAFKGDTPGAADRYARSAAVLSALATTDTGNALFHWQALTDTLTALLTADVPDEPPVRSNAILAMANLGDPNATGPLIGFFGAASGASKAAAGKAVASLGRKNPIVLDDAAFQVLLAGTGDGDPDVRASAFAALGACQLTPDQSLACAVANRPSVGAPGGGEGCGEGDGATLSAR